MNAITSKLTSLCSVALVAVMLPLGPTSVPVVPTPHMTRTPAAVKIQAPQQLWQIYQTAGEQAFLANNIDFARKQFELALKKATNRQQRIQTLVSMEDLYESQFEFVNEEKVLASLISELKQEPLKAVQLGQVYSKLGTMATLSSKPNAEQLYWMSAREFERARATDSYEYAFVLLNLAQIHQRNKQYSTAEKLFFNARTKFDKLSGKDNYNSAKISETLGDLCVQSRRKNDAQKYYMDAIRTYEAIFGATSSDVKSVKRKFKQAGGNYHKDIHWKDCVDWVPICLSEDLNEVR